MYRAMEINDVAEVLKIERKVYATGWTRAELKQCLSECPGLVLVIRGNIYGYVIYGQNDDKIDVIRFVVHPAHRGWGYGHEMLKHFGAGRKVRFHVEDTDLEAQLFLRSCGYRCHYIKRRWFEEGADAYVFTNEPSIAALR
jgi:ribosomal protein S18 acetylase RimI-like enzyme